MDLDFRVSSTLIQNVNILNHVFINNKTASIINISKKSTKYHLKISYISNNKKEKITFDKNSIILVVEIIECKMKILKSIFEENPHQENIYEKNKVKFHILYNNKNMICSFNFNKDDFEVLKNISTNEYYYITVVYYLTMDNHIYDYNNIIKSITRN